LNEDTNGSERNLGRKWVRVLHIYISLYALLLLLFFGVTGFMMNHPGWFGFGEIHTEQRVATLPMDLCAQGDRLAIVEHLRREHGFRGLVQACEIEGQEIRVSIARAGHQAGAVIDRATGQTDITVETKGLAAKLAAVHSGEHTGQFGRRVIDVTAVFLILTSITGLLLWCSLSIRRETGIIWLVTSSVVAIVIGAKLLF